MLEHTIVPNASYLVNFNICPQYGTQHNAYSIRELTELLIIGLTEKSEQIEERGTENFSLLSLSERALVVIAKATRVPYSRPRKKADIPF
jgi:hypothetical protein